MPARKKGFFALKLKELRVSAGLTQAQLAKKAGISLGAVRLFEQDRRRPGYDAIRQLAQALDISAGVLFDEAAPPPWHKKRK
jgi:transcriptional regulator with XRE-family HTH domain